MKKFFTLFVVVSTFLTISCSKSDDSADKNDNPANPFIGTWALESINGTNVTDGCIKKTAMIIKQGEIIDDSYFPNEKGACQSQSATFKYTFSDGKITNLAIEGGELEVVPSFTIVNGKLVVASEEGKLIYKRK